MAEKRVARTRAPDERPTSRAVSALSRRTGRRPQRTDPVVQYFGEDDDTPVIQLLKGIRPTTQNFRGGEHVHVSDVIGKCIRKIALMRRMKVRHAAETIMDGQGITFAIGEALHDFVKAKFIKGHPDKVWADWKCSCGETTYRGTYAKRSPTVCPKCETAVDRHNEVPFINPDFMLKGNPDLLLWMDEYGAFYIIEIKSMAAKMWTELERPVPDHTVQIALYWTILKRLGIPVVDRVSILYANKEFSFKFPYKEYMIDPQAVDLSPYIEDLEALKAADDGGPLPARVVCGTESAPEAKKCPVCVTCFGCD